MLKKSICLSTAKNVEWWRGESSNYSNGGEISKIGVAEGCPNKQTMRRRRHLEIALKCRKEDKSKTGQEMSRHDAGPTKSLTESSGAG